MSDLPDWKILVEKAREGDRTSLTELIDQTRKPLYAFCYYLCQNRQLAEDITHDAYVKAFSSLDQLKNADVFVAWLKSIARSKFLDFKKAASQSKTHVSFLEIGEIGFLEPGMDAEQFSAMQVLARMPEEDRLILTLVDIQEHSYEETATILGIPTGTVKSRLFRSREKFAELYRDASENSINYPEFRRRA
jgi:RNA polymerase sigma-70 factor, ECF subfamily